MLAPAASCHPELSSRYAPILKKVRGHLVLEPEGKAGALTWCVLCKKCAFVGVLPCVCVCVYFEYQNTQSGAILAGHHNFKGLVEV